MQPHIADGTARVSYPGVRMFYSMDSPYERQLLAEHVLVCSQSRNQVQVEIGSHCWILQRTRVGRARCSVCGEPLHTFCETPTGEQRLCVACAIEDSAAGMSSPPAPEPTS